MQMFWLILCEHSDVRLLLFYHLAILALLCLLLSFLCHKIAYFQPLHSFFFFFTHFSLFWHFTEVQAWGRRSNISATLPAAGRFTGRRLIFELICAGTVERDPSSATGCSAGRGSPGATSCRDTGGHTQVRRCSNKSCHF